MGASGTIKLYHTQPGPRAPSRPPRTAQRTLFWGAVWCILALTVSNRVAASALVGALLLAGSYALFSQKTPPPEPPIVPRPESNRTQERVPHAAHQDGRDPHATHQDGLPPGHPPLGSAPAGADRPAPASAPSDLTWTAPAEWKTAPNPSPMRIATFKIPVAGKDTEEAELSISRAGGSTDANLQRWVGQFEEAGKDTRATRTVRGMKVTTVEVSGTYLGGMMMGGGAAKKPGWSLLGAIVETQGSSYFFKMTGPTATVKNARIAFDGMLDSIAPK